MNPSRTLKVFAILLGVYGLAVLPGLFVPGYLDSPIGVVVAIPYISIYLFDMVGIPGLLQHGGMCGWGWCAPTVFGWIFLGVVWLGLAWLTAKAIAAAFGRSEQ